MRRMLCIPLVLWVVSAFTAESQRAIAAVVSPAGGVRPPAVADLDPSGLAYHLATNALRRTAKANDPATAMPLLYSNGKWSQAFYQYKPYQPRWSKTCWLYGVKGLSATCLGYTNGHGGVYPITMISPRHYVASWHIASWFPFCAGKDAAVFLDNKNVLHQRRSLQCEHVTTADLAVGLLDADLPASVGFLPVLPANYTNYLRASDWVQGIGGNQDLLVFSRPIRFDTMLVSWDPDAAIVGGLSAKWSLRIRNGDSSFPARLLIGNQLVLVSCTSTTFGGSDYAKLGGHINSAMHQLSVTNHLNSDYRLTTVDLSGFARAK